MPAAAIIPAAISAGTSLVGGLLGSHAAKSAAQLQQEAAEKAAAETKATGEQAATDITQAGQTAASGVTAAGDTAATGVTQAGSNAATGVKTAAGTSAAGVNTAADQANQILAAQYGVNINALNPYTSAGATAQEQLAAGIAPGGQFNKTFQASDLEMDPGYQFRLSEGQKALERSAAAGGSLGSGGTLKALSRYSQGVASDEDSKAFERYRVGQNDAFSRLNTIAGTGLQATNTGIQAGTQLVRDASGNIVHAGDTSAQFGYQGARDAAGYETTAAAQAGQFGTNAAAQAGQFMLNSIGQAGNFRTQAQRQAAQDQISGADAVAAGKVSSANAWSGALGGIGNAVGQGYSMSRNMPPANYGPNPMGNPTASLPYAYDPAARGVYYTGIG
jgi:hypothetical protein